VSAAPTVRLATRDELPAVGRVLARAFADDPVYTWLAPPSPERDDRAADWFEREARVQFDHHGEVWVDDELRGAAVWTAPGHWRGGVREALPMLLPSLRYYRRRVVRGLRTVGAMQRAHPARPEHWYLALLGTDPDHGGHGIGSALVRAVTGRCDRYGLGAYLESSKEQNVPFYGRLGFVASAPIGVSGGPGLIPMWRDPEPPA